MVPALCNRDQREKWNKDGKTSLRKKAEKKVRKILSKPEIPALDIKVLEKIQKEIPGIKVDVFEDRGAAYQATYAAAFKRGKITSVAAHCWNGMLLLQADEVAERVVRRALSASGRPLAGLLGPWGQVVWVAWTLDLPQDSPGPTVISQTRSDWAAIWKFV